MALQYKIQFLKDEKDDDGNDVKRVSFEVQDMETNKLLFIDKVLPRVKDKTDNAYCVDAQALMTDQIAEWQAQIGTEGHIFNPDSGKIE